MDIQIEVRGLEDAYQKFGTDVLRLIEPGIQSGAIRVERRLKVYPPPIPGQRYRRGIDPRSERLGQRWTNEIRRTSVEVRGQVGNTASYAPWVQSEQFQARVHWDRWETDEQALEAEKDNIEGDIERVLIRGLTE